MPMKTEQDKDLSTTSIFDTHESRYSRPVPLWNMRNEYTDDVIETLESTFGELDNKVTLGEAVMSAAQMPPKIICRIILMTSYMLPRTVS